MARYPRTIRSGPLAGQVFETEGDHREALDAARNGPPKPKKKPHPHVTKQMATGLVAFSNMALSVIPQTREDTLDDVEQAALVIAIVETAKTNRFFANIVYNVCTVQSGARLGTTVGCIVAKRLARREILPLTIGVSAEMMLYALAQEEMPAAPPEGESVDHDEAQTIDLSPNGSATYEGTPVVASG